MTRQISKTTVLGQVDTVKEILKGGTFITAAMLNAPQTDSSSDAATEWKRGRRIFCDSLGLKGYCAQNGGSFHRPPVPIGQVCQDHAETTEFYSIIVRATPEGIECSAWPTMGKTMAELGRFSGLRLPTAIGEPTEPHGRRRRTLKGRVGGDSPGMTVS